MKVTIVPIGNSKGIRIPKPILEHCRIKKEVILETEGHKIIIRPARRNAREDWEQSFKKMSEKKDDKLFIDGSIDLHIGKWEW